MHQSILNRVVYYTSLCTHGTNFKTAYYIALNPQNLQDSNGLQGRIIYSSLFLINIHKIDSSHMIYNFFLCHGDCIYNIKSYRKLTLFIWWAFHTMLNVLYQIIFYSSFFGHRVWWYWSIKSIVHKCIVIKLVQTLLLFCFLLMFVIKWLILKNYFNIYNIGSSLVFGVQCNILEFCFFYVSTLE